MAYPDNLAFLQATIKALLPSASFAQGSGTGAITQAVATVWDDIQSLSANTSAQMFIATATGDYLTARGLDYNVPRSAGTPATATVTFTAPSTLALSNIPINTALATAGNGITMTPIVFQTSSAAMIGGGVTSVTVPIISVLPGSAANVAANAITIIRNALPGISISASTAASGGTDPTSDAVQRTIIASVIAPAGTTATLQLIALSQSTSTNSVTQAYVVTGGTAGTLTVYVYDALGTFVSPGTPDLVLLTQIQNAILAAVPLGIVPGTATGTFATIGGVTFSAFTITTLSALAVTYSAPSGIQSSYIQPLMQTAISSYLSSLPNGQFPNAFGISNAAQTGTGYILTYLLVTTTMPTTTTSTTLYRASPTITYTWTRQ